MEAWNSCFDCAAGRIMLHAYKEKFIVFSCQEVIHRYWLHMQHIRKYLPELLSLISELWSSFSLPAANCPDRGPPVRLALLYAYY